MNNFRKTAIIVGMLFIIGTVAGFLFKMVFTGSIQNDLNLLTQVAANEKQVITGALFLLIMGLALAMVLRQSPVSQRTKSAFQAWLDLSKMFCYTHC
jgi:hypothetical protein